MTETKTKTKAKTKTAVEEPLEESLEEQLELLDVPKAVDRKFVHPITNEERTYVQHELGFLPKLRLFQLLSGTIRLATENDMGNTNQFINEAFSGTGDLSNEGFIEMFMKLIELSPDFFEEASSIILKVPKHDIEWFNEALDELDDETGIDIIDTFIAQNGKSLRDFFTKHLARLQKRATAEFAGLDMGQESETTT